MIFPNFLVWIWPEMRPHLQLCRPHDRNRVMRRCGLAKRKNVEGGRKRAYIHELASLPTIALFHERKTSFSGHGLLFLLISRVSFLLATGSRLGKGFDSARLDTPLLAMPFPGEEFCDSMAAPSTGSMRIRGKSKSTTTLVFRCECWPASPIIPSTASRNSYPGTS